MLEILKSIILGIIEGITEWLPISSTGHLILADEFIKHNVTAEFKEMFEVVIQLGAILAVVVLFWNKLWPFTTKEKGYINRWPEKIDLENRDDEFCRTKIIEMYANPVKNYLEAVK